MTLNEYTPEEISEMSMVEIAYELMRNEKQPFAFGDLVKRVAEIKGLSEEYVSERISYLYADLNIDGRFIALGENRWGLRTWYPYEQADEEVTQTVRRKKKKAEDDEDLEIELDEDFDDLDGDLDDEYEDLEDELDDLVSEENEEEDFDLDLDEEEDVDADDSEDDLDEDLEAEDEDDLL
ncbi:DNA-directed RNA polymerase subunit delta [Anaerobacillus alkaliphilus]|uniref:Probable DNA-directed RNA polymerase subunit delta n=1 Tax=Anaerobacillus alkaliphilus TaxID=1548597 RepID=A0A4Q0VW29_9BACI|nr:DNA-directed RNA polymerase subunit delta [Anaerobacillus alkaliphilus]RXJ02725.1 DNA-directed RNA polymerase subunit delta [Anaerobacillus alkaliphilus]